jgi:hypothetical protein
MPSFDVVSEVDNHELTNAIDQTNRELATRYDFKGADATVTQQDGLLLLEAENEFQLDQMLSILYQKMAKRGVEVSHLDIQPIEITGKRARQTINIRQGIDKELAKKIIKLVKDSRIKVQTAIQGEQIRISGKKRDDLQQVIGMLRSAGLPQPLQYENFRD